jgi:hypothetical protein
MISIKELIHIIIKIVTIVVALDFFIFGFLLIINKESIYKFKFIAYFIYNIFNINNYKGNWKLVKFLFNNKAIGIYLLLGGLFMILIYILGI